MRFGYLMFAGDGVLSDLKFFLGCAGGVVILGQILWLGVLLYMAYFKLDLFLNYFKNSPEAKARINFRGGGPWGRVFVLIGVIGIVLNPDKYVRDGRASAEDVNNFPVVLRRKIILMWRVALFLLIAMFVVWGMMKVYGV